MINGMLVNGTFNLPNMTLNRENLIGIGNSLYNISTNSCKGKEKCNGYYVYPKCLIDLYQGIGTCQEFYLVDSFMNGVDLDRLEYLKFNMINEYDCNILEYVTPNNIDSLQVKKDSELLVLNKDNLSEIKDECIFTSVNFDIVDYCNDCEYIQLGSYTNKNSKIIEDINIIEFGEIIFNPIPNNGDIKVCITIKKQDTPSIPLTLFYNGLPQEDKTVIENGDDLIIEYNIIDVLDANIGNINISSIDSNFNKYIVNIKEIKFINNNTYNIGNFKICYQNTDTQKLLPLNINGLFTIKFKDDDNLENGSTYIIQCVNLGRIMKNINIQNVVIEEKD